MQDHDDLIDGGDLSADRMILPRLHLENAAHGRRCPAIRDAPKQLRRSVAASSAKWRRRTLLTMVAAAPTIVGSGDGLPLLR